MTGESATRASKLREYAYKMSKQEWLDVYALAARYNLSVRSVWNIIRDAGLEGRRPPVRTTFKAADFARALKAQPRRPRARRTSTIGKG